MLLKIDNVWSEYVKFLDNGCTILFNVEFIYWITLTYEVWGTFLSENNKEDWMLFYWYGRVLIEHSTRMSDKIWIDYVRIADRASVLFGIFENRKQKLNIETKQLKNKYINYNGNVHNLSDFVFA